MAKTQVAIHCETEYIGSGYEEGGGRFALKVETISPPEALQVAKKLKPGQEVLFNRGSSQSVQLNGRNVLEVTVWNDDGLKMKGFVP